MAAGAPRIKKEREVRTFEIETAAKKVFLSRGYQNATIQEIAQKAGVAKGTVYLYYKGKEDLYVSLMLPSQQLIESKLTGLLADVNNQVFSSGHDLMVALADTLLEIQDKDPEMNMIYQAFQVGGIITDISDERLGQLAIAARNIFGIMRKMIDKAVETRLIADVDVVETVDVLWATFLGVAQLEWSKLTWTKKDHLRNTLHHAFGLLCAGLCAGTKSSSRRARKAKG